MRTINKKYLIWHDELNPGMFKIVNDETDETVLRNLPNAEAAEQTVAKFKDESVFKQAMNRKPKGGESKSNNFVGIRSRSKVKGGSMIKEETVPEVVEEVTALVEEEELVNEEIEKELESKKEVKPVSKPTKASKTAEKKPLLKPTKEVKPQKPTKLANAESKRAVGKTTKLGVQAAWFYILQKNESSKPKLSDEQITAWMYKEFPEKKSACFKQVSGARRKFNLGLFGKLPKGFNLSVKKVEKKISAPKGK
ncbi:MAG TPA: hypothetical protein DCE80_14305 [Ignavibacteriales bacterium]|nr:hypothetical protein [Ignavibacteriales bacterium]